MVDTIVGGFAMNSDIAAEKSVDGDFIDEGPSPPDAAAKGANGAGAGAVVTTEPRWATARPYAEALDRNQLARLLGRSRRGGR
jgi:hypothetical protein